MLNWSALAGFDTISDHDVDSGKDDEQETITVIPDFGA